MAMSTKVGTFAFYSRVLVLLMQILFNLVIPDHDAKVFNPPMVHKKLPLDYIAEVLVEGFRRWDGVYFHHIAEHGYTYENTLVFFPLFPFIVRIVANTLLYPLQFVCNYGNTLTLAAFIVNFVVFIQSAKLLYQLSLHILCDERLAFKAAQLYCINPASIFFSAFYSETLFAFFTFKGMLNLEKERPWTGCLMFGFSALTRSNGLVNAGFVVYRNFIQLIRSIKTARNANYAEKKTIFIAVSSSMYFVLCNVLLQLFLCVLPFLTFQYYAYTVFCNRETTYRDLQSHVINYGNQQGYKMPHTGLSLWCSDKIPYSYSYVQTNHWGVAFMNYWTFKQIPNFALATPIILLSLTAIFSYIYNNLKVCLSLGLISSRFESNYKKTDDHGSGTTVGFHKKEVFVYVVELTFLLMFGIFFMHIQVLTRFICSSSPVIYWFIACTTTPSEKLSTPEHHKQDTFSSLKQDHADTGDSTQKQPENCTDTYESSQKTSQVNSEGGEAGVNNGDSGGMENDRVIGKSSTDDISMNDLDELYDWDSNNWLHRAVFIYIHLYFFVGIAAFSNFLPWT